MEGRRRSSCYLHRCFVHNTEIHARSKKKNASKLALTGEEPIKSEALLKRNEKERETETVKSQVHESSSPGPAGPSVPIKTAAERKFEETQRRRVSSSLILWNLD